MASRATSAAVKTQAMAMLDRVEQRQPGVLDRLRVDALAEVQTWPDVQVRLVDETSSTAGGCSVAGSYNDETQPPTLCVAVSASPGRRQFTALHELGHHLQNTDTDLGTRILMAADDRFEDDACDLFAARVLLPDAVVSGCFGDQTPTAGDIVALYRKSSASRAACVVRAAEHLASFGAVVLYDADGAVSFATAKGIYPPARGSDQSQTALVAAALRDPWRADGAAFTADSTTIRYRSGHSSDPLYGQAAWCDGYLIAVLVTDHAPWQTFSPPRPGVPAQRQPTEAECEVCGNLFEVTGLCATCNEPRCPSGHCTCTLKRERRCEHCMLTYGLAMFPAGGTVCRDCL